MAVIAVLLAVTALAWLQGFIYRKQWSRHLRLMLSFSERCATEGDTLTLTEVIINRKLLPLPWLAVKFQVSKYLLFRDKDNANVTDDYYRNDLFNPLMFQKITRQLSFVCGKRGYYTVKSAELVSGDILAREKLTRSVPFNASLTVYPRTINIDALLTTHRQFLGQILTKRFIQPDPFEFKGIREYQPYDSLRAVNFKATAKTGELMVNIRDYTVSQEIVLLFNGQKYSAFPSDALYEDAIRLTASLAAYYIGNGVPLSFVTNAGSVADNAVVSGAGGANGAIAAVSGAGSVVGSVADSAIASGAGGVGGSVSSAVPVSALTWLDAGSGTNHLSSINEALARIDLRKSVAVSGKAMVEEVVDRQVSKRRTGQEPAYILLSTFHEKDLWETYRTLAETGADVLWIIPVLQDMDITVPLSERVVRVAM